MPTTSALFRQTTPCSLNDAADLATELRRIGYRPETDQADEPNASRSTPPTGIGPSQHFVNQPSTKRSKIMTGTTKATIQFYGCTFDPSGPGSV